MQSGAWFGNVAPSADSMITAMELDVRLEAEEQAHLLRTLPPFASKKTTDPDTPARNPTQQQQQQNIIMQAQQAPVYMAQSAQQPQQPQFQTAYRGLA